jgi:hypothetical protein
MAVHTHAWLEEVDPYAVPHVAFVGGHSFKLRAMPSAHYLFRKHAFISRLRPAPAVAPQLIDT